MTPRVLFVGGTGFIGKTVLDRWLDPLTTDAIDVTISSRDPDAFLRAHPHLARRLTGKVQLIRQKLPELTACGRYDMIIHGAETPTAAFSESARADSVQAMEQLLRFAQASDARRIVYLSSGAVYRVDDRLISPFDASAELVDRQGDRDLYARAKFQNERSLRDFSARTGISHSVVRIFNVASAHVPLSGRFALGNFVRDMLDPSVAALAIRGSGRDRRSFMAGRSLADLIAHCLIDAPDGAIFNGCSTSDLSIAELAALVREVVGIDKPIVIEAPDAPAADYAGVANLPAPFLSSQQDLRVEIANLVAAARGGAGLDDRAVEAGRG